MIKYTSLVLLLIFFCSCASYLNQATQQITIETNKPCEMTVNGEKLPWISSHQRYQAIRSKDSLHISFKKDSITKQISVPAENSFAYYLNAYPGFWVGFWIEKNEPKRYAYPAVIYSDLNNPNVPYLSYKPSNPEDLKHKNILKLSPITPIQAFNPDVELAYERRISNRLSAQFGTSYLLRNPVYNTSFDSETKGYTLSLQAKYFFNGNAQFGKYIAFEVYYLNENHKTNDSFQDTTTKGNPYPIYCYTDTFKIKKQTLSFNFLYGYQYRIDQFTVDLYCGLGLRYKDVKQSGRKNPRDAYQNFPDLDIKRLLNEEGQNWVPNFSLNFRIGYNF